MFQKIVSDIDSIEFEMLEQCPEIRKLLDQYRDKTEAGRNGDRKRVQQRLQDWCAVHD